MRLLEDDSPVVRDAVRGALADFGDGLYDDLRRANIVLEASQRDLLETLRASLPTDEGFLAAWSEWAGSDLARDAGLETGMGLLSRAIRGDRGAPDALSKELGTLADAYLAAIDERGHVAGVHSLSEFLFKTHGFCGDDDDYYLPRNSDLLSVIDRRKGNPISLACLYRLVAGRVDLDVGSCNFPGHFMARVVVEDRVFLVDCFNGGRFVSAEDLRGRLANASDFIDDVPAVGAIVRRALMNLVNAFTQIGEKARADDFRSMVDCLSE